MLVGSGYGRQGVEPDSKAVWWSVYQRLPRGAPDRELWGISGGPPQRDLQGC